MLLFNFFEGGGEGQNKRFSVRTGGGGGWGGGHKSANLSKRTFWMPFTVSSMLKSKGTPPVLPNCTRGN